jgi:hypothetical protein
MPHYARIVQGLGTRDSEMMTCLNEPFIVIEGCECGDGVSLIPISAAAIKIGSVGYE